MLELAEKASGEGKSCLTSAVGNIILRLWPKPTVGRWIPEYRLRDIEIWRTLRLGEGMVLYLMIYRYVRTDNLSAEKNHLLSI